MSIYPTKLTVAGATIEFIEGSPIEITYSRGVDPSQVAFVVGSGRKADKALKNAKNPVEIKLECAGLKTIDSESITLKGWYVTARREREKGFVEYQLQDVRWVKSFNKLTAQYNILSYGGNYRRESVPAVGFAWRAYDACVDALEKLGFTVTDNPKLAAGIKAIPLPDNLGNALGGGWVAADITECMPPMLESIACDIVMLDDGSVQIQDRVTGAAGNLLKYAQVTGDVAAADIKWQKPKNIIVPFPKRIERRGTYNEAVGATSTGAVPYNVDLENVIPNYIPGGSEQVKDHTEFKTYVAKYFMTLKKVRERWFKRVMFDLLGSLTSVQYFQLSVIQSLVQQSYRQRFRFKPPDSASAKNVATSEIRAHFADLQLGRLQRDGTTRKDGVYMNHVRELRFGKLPKRGNGKPKANKLEAKFTENVAFSATVPAPATAQWIDREALVFDVVFPASQNSNYTGYFPGTLEADRGYGSFKDSVSGKGKFELEDTVGLTDDFDMYVYWHGLWVHDGKGDQERTYKSTGSAFKDGQVGELTARLVHDMTANYGTDAFNSFPGTLLNRDDLKARATQIADEIMASFEQEKAGITTQVGIAVLTKGKVWTRGNIHEIKIIIGGRKPGSVETRITVLPGKRPKMSSPITGKRAEGLEPMRIL